jgi:hypothetical protein
VKAARQERIEATVAGLEAAVTRGTRQGETTAASVAARTAAIAAVRAALDDTTVRLTTLLEDSAGAAVSG